MNNIYNIFCRHSSDYHSADDWRRFLLAGGPYVLQLAGSASVQHERETSVQASAGHSTDAGIRIGLNTIERCEQCSAFGCRSMAES